jgi:hypothetical protein
MKPKRKGSLTRSSQRTRRNPIAIKARQTGAAQQHIVRNRDGDIWARGTKVGDTMTGYWEWFRKDGTKLRSGYFADGKQVGQWTTYDQQGNVYKVTEM